MRVIGGEWEKAHPFDMDGVLEDDRRCHVHVVTGGPKAGLTFQANITRAPTL